MVRVCGKNVKRKACEEMCKYIAEGKRSVGKSRKRWLDDENGRYRLDENS